MKKKPAKKKAPRRGPAIRMDENEITLKDNVVCAGTPDDCLCDACSAARRAKWMSGAEPAEIGYSNDFKVAIVSLLALAVVLAIGLFFLAGEVDSINERADAFSEMTLSFQRTDAIEHEARVMREERLRHPSLQRARRP